MQIGKTEPVKPAQQKTIIPNDRETYYKLKQFVRQQRSFEQLQDWLDKKQSYKLSDHLQKLYNRIMWYIDQQEGGNYAP